MLKQSLGEIAGDHSNTPLFGYFNFVISMVSLMQVPQPFLYVYNNYYNNYFNNDKLTRHVPLKGTRHLVHQINVKLSIRLRSKRNWAPNPLRAIGVD